MHKGAQENSAVLFDRESQVHQDAPEDSMNWDRSFHEKSAVRKLEYKNPKWPDVKYKHHL